ADIGALREPEECHDHLAVEILQGARLPIVVGQGQALAQLGARDVVALEAGRRVGAGDQEAGQPDCRRAAQQRTAGNIEQGHVANSPRVRRAGRPSDPAARQQTTAPGTEWKSGTGDAPARRCTGGTAARRIRRTGRPAPGRWPDTAGRSCARRKAAWWWPPAPGCTAGYAGE